MFVAICDTMKLSSCARKVGSSEEITSPIGASVVASPPAAVLTDIRTGKIETIAKTAQKILKLGRGQRCGCAAADKNRLRRNRPAGSPLVQFSEQRFAKALR
jgi:hypothetical protein